MQIPSRPMPERELPYKAALRVAQTSLTAEAGQRLSLSVCVRNVSDWTWPTVRLGNHWLSESGQLMVRDDGRVSLPAAMKPRQETEVTITVTAPKQPGATRPEFDVVQESVHWFQTMGSQTVRIPCHVHAASQPFLDTCRGLQERLRAPCAAAALPKIAERRTSHPQPSAHGTDARRRPTDRSHW